MESRTRGVSILAYHGVTKRDDWTIGNRRRLHVPVALFRRHVEVISARWRPIGLTAYLAGIRKGDSFPPRTLVITFDDGYRNFLTSAWPTLREHGVPVTLFIPTHSGARLWPDRLEVALGSTQMREIQWQGRSYPLGTRLERSRAAAALVHEVVHHEDETEKIIEELLARLDAPEAIPDEDRDRLTWSELRQLRSEGVEVGSHADRHEDLRRRRIGDVRAAFAASLERLNAELGSAEYSLAYPYGGHNAEVRAAARDAGFAAAATTDPGPNVREPDLFALRRSLVGADDNLIRLRATMTGLRAIARGRAAL
jgi:peptidoglycan/xylan/chitin deacetylase (PgdA/CDA1 family)